METVGNLGLDKFKKIVGDIVFSKLRTVKIKLDDIAGTADKKNKRDLHAALIPSAELERVADQIKDTDELDSKYFSEAGLTKAVVRSLLEEYKAGGAEQVKSVLKTIFDELPKKILKIQQREELDFGEAVAALDGELFDAHFEKEALLSKLQEPDFMEYSSSSMTQDEERKLVNSSVDLALHYIDEMVNADKKPEDPVAFTAMVVNNLIEAKKRYLDFEVNGR